MLLLFCQITELILYIPLKELFCNALCYSGNIMQTSFPLSSFFEKGHIIALYISLYHPEMSMIFSWMTTAPQIPHSLCALMSALRR